MSEQRPNEKRYIAVYVEPSSFRMEIDEDWSEMTEEQRQEDLYEAFLSVCKTWEWEEIK